MPCQDVTDYCHIALNSEDQLLDYLFCKRTCGGSVGDENLLLDWAKTKSIDEILETSLEQIFAVYKPTNEEEKFLLIKHFQALVAVLGVYKGYEITGLEEACTLGAINFGINTIEIEAHLRVEMDVFGISPCGGCGSGSGGTCGSEGGSEEENDGCGCTTSLADLLAGKDHAANTCGTPPTESFTSDTSKRLKLF